MHAIHGQKYDPPLLLTKSQMEAEIRSDQDTEERREYIFSFADRTQKSIHEMDPFDDLLEVDA